MIKTLWDSFRNQQRATLSQVASIDPELTASPAGRLGELLIKAAILARVLEPALTLTATAILLILGAAVPGLAQQPPGGSIFGGNDQTLANGVREAIKWGRNLLFLLGVGGIGWSMLNYMTEKPWIKQAIGGAGCFGFASIAALIYSFSQGHAVQVDTDLGN